MQNHVNGKMKVEGDLDAVRFWAGLLVDVWGAQARKPEPDTESRLRTVSYDIPIMGNPKAGAKTVVLKVVEDEREGKGVLKIEGGGEYLQWQAKAKYLCSCCQHLDWIGTSLVCNRLFSPSKHKKSCEGYKYKEAK